MSTEPNTTEDQSELESEGELLEDIQILADLIQPLMFVLDASIAGIDLGLIERALDTLSQQAQKLEALPRPETQDKSELMSAQYCTLKALCDLVVARKHQQTLTVKQSKGTVGNQALRHMGLL